MSKYCQNCGAVMDDNAVFCSNCGAQSNVVVSNGAAPAYAPATAASSFSIDGLLGKLSGLLDKKNRPILIGAVAVIIVLIIIISSASGAGWKSALNNYIDVTIHGKVEKIEKLAPKEYWDYREDETDRDLDDIKDDFEDNVDDLLDRLEDEYGKRIKVSYKVEDKKTLSKHKLEKIADALNDQYDIKESSVKKAIEVELEMTIKGSEDDDDDEVEFTFVKIGSKWYMISYYSNGDEYRVSFVGA